jgi:hypothetical protein
MAKGEAKLLYPGLDGFYANTLPIACPSLSPEIRVALPASRTANAAARARHRAHLGTPAARNARINRWR